MKCKICNKEYSETNGKQYPEHLCSYRCYEKWLSENKTPNCTCPACGKQFYLKQSRIKRVKHKPCCCRKCGSIYRKTYTTGEQNHQWGLRGPLNSSFISETRVTNYGYVADYCPNHPFKRGDDGRVLRHRLVVEEHSDLFDPSYFIEIDGHKYLKKEYVVHHKNHNKMDNRIENLEIMTLSAHSSMHNLEKAVARDKKSGRFLKLASLNRAKTGKAEMPIP